ncbi:hypothetical protein [Cellulomonas sp. URHB0016]
MLKRLLTAAIGVVGLVVVALGIASATVWRADDVLVAQSHGDARTLVTDPGVLELGGDPVTVTVRVPDKSRVVLAVGRDTDVEGWVGPDAHDRVTGLSSWDQLALKGVEPDVTPSPAPSDAAAPPTPAPTDAAGVTAADASTVADPTGSDMWVAEAEGKGSATLVWHAQPGRWSLLAVSAEGDAVPTLSLAWPRVVTTPWLWPCVVVGGLLVLLSLGLVLRGALRRRAGIVGPQWRDVGTGPTPTVEPSRAGLPALTRRQLREGAAAGSSRLTEPAAPHNPSGDRGAEMPAPVSTTGARTSAPVPARTAEGPGLTAVTAASTRRALRTGSQPAVAPAGHVTDQPPDAAAAARVAGQANQARVPVAPSGGPPSESAAAWGSASSRPGSTTQGRTGAWTPGPAPATAPHPGVPTGAGGPGGDADRSGSRPGGRTEPAEAVHGRPAWATGPIPVTRPGPASAGPGQPAPGAVSGSPRPAAPGTSGPGAVRAGAVGAAAGGPGPAGRAASGPAAAGPGTGASGRPTAWSAAPPAPGPRSVQGSGSGSSGPDGPRSHVAHRPAWLHEPGTQSPAGQPSRSTVPHASAPQGPADEGPGDQAGSRGDAWRRAWGLPPLEHDGPQEPTREEDR